MATVSIGRCPAYEPEALLATVESVLGALPALPDLRDRTVMLKPNLLSPNDPPEMAVNTHPEFVRAVGRFFLSRGVGRLIIGDSCGSLSPGSTNRAIALTGLDIVAGDLKAEMLNVDRLPWEEVEIPNGQILSHVRLPRILREVDLLVTLPKLKTHGLTVMTGAIKNQFGLTPGRAKKDIHLVAPSPHAMSQALLDMHSVIRPGLAILDGVVGMEGNGPAAGRPRETGLMLAADDCLAMDAVIARIVGLQPDDLDVVRLGRERGLGVGRLEEISIRGVPLEEVLIRDFAMPPQHVRKAVFALIPDWFWRWAFNIAGSAHAVVMDDRCVRCGECVANCPAKAIEALDGKIYADPARCIACYCCSEVCKERAIRFQRPLAGRLLIALRKLRRAHRPRASRR